MVWLSGQFSSLEKMKPRAMKSRAKLEARSMAEGTLEDHGSAAAAGMKSMARTMTTPTALVPKRTINMRSVRNNASQRAG